MKTLHKTLCLLALMLTATFVFTACNDDDEVGYDISGTWYGDLKMYYDGERAQYTEITFKASGGAFSWRRGTGTEIDHYRNRTIRHTFDYEIQKGIIYLDFDDRSLDCSIRDYVVDDLSFWGWLDGRTNSVQFRLEKYLDSYSSSYRDYDNDERRGVKAVGTVPADTDAQPAEYRSVNY